MCRMQPLILVLAICAVPGFPFDLPAQEPRQARRPHESWVSDAHNDVIVVVPESRLIVSAFSVDTGSWGSTALNVPLDPKSNVTVSGKLAVFESNDCIYAFSAKGAHWDKLPIPQGAVATITSYNNYIQVRMDGSIFLYSVNSDKWTGKNLATGLGTPVEPSGQKTK